MQFKCGHRVILKASAAAPKNCAKETKHFWTALAGDEGKVISRTKNGWLRIRIDRTGAIKTIRNGWERLDKVQISKIKRLPFDQGQCMRVGVSYAWWSPLQPEPHVAAEIGDQGIWYDHKKGKLMGTEDCEPGGEHILFGKQVQVSPPTWLTCEAWSPSEEETTTDTDDQDDDPDYIPSETESSDSEEKRRAAEDKRKEQVEENSEALSEIIDKILTHSPAWYNTPRSTRNNEYPDPLALAPAPDKWYSWGPQGPMGPRWGSSYTGD